jgi:ribosomal protein L44E
MRKPGIGDGWKRDTHTNGSLTWMKCQSLSWGMAKDSRQKAGYGGNPKRSPVGRHMGAES